MEIPQEGKYVCKLNGPMVIYEASTGSLCAAVPSVMVDSGFTFKHTMVLVKADGTIQTKTTDTLKSVFGWDGVDPFWLMDNSEDGGSSGANRMYIVGVNAGGKEITNRSNGVIPNVYVRPAAPVITTVNFGYEGDEGAQMVWLDLTWTWNPGAWPDDGVFQILGCKDDTQGMFLMATFPASARSARVETTLPLEDTVYYYQMVYIHGNTYGAWTPVGEFYPF